LSPVNGLHFLLSSSPSDPPSPSIPNDSDSTSYQIGIFFAWTCAGLYLSSRLPQILHNAQRQSVDGLALPMFACAVMGNLTYASSLVLSDAAIQGGWAFWKCSLPYLLGSAGTLVFDAIIFGQSLRYTNTSSGLKGESTIDDEEIFQRPSS
jgi:hypothetical protein